MCNRQFSFKLMKLCTPWCNFSCVDHKDDHPCRPGAADEDGIFKGQNHSKVYTELFSLQSQMVCMNGENWSLVRCEKGKWGIHIWNCFSTSWSLSLRHSLFDFRQTNFKDKLQFSRTKIWLINWHSWTPPLNTLLAKTLDGAIQDFYFFSHGWSHYFILLSETTLYKMSTVTGYVKKQKQDIFTQKCFYVTSEFFRFLQRGWAKISSAK